MIALYDLDCVKYSAAAVGEKRIIEVVHKTTGRSKQFSNRTEFYGRGKNKDGGWLAELNKYRESPFTYDEFDIQDIQTPEPIENALHTAKCMVENALAASKADKMYGFIGKGDSFRVELSTILKYKGQRVSNLRPIHLDEVAEYLRKKYTAQVVEHYEVDDVVVMESYNKPEKFILGLDKDYYQSNKFFNINRPEEGIVDCNGFGRLHKTDKGKIRGSGRMFLYWQVCALDASDNYRANCASDIPWAELKAYSALKDCTNDKEAWQKMVDVFKLLYPEPKVITGWRGNEFEIDWKCVLNECFQMARLRRWVGDEVSAYDVLDKMGVI